MKRYVDRSYFHLHLDEPEDKSQPPMTQLTRIRLPDNFASTQQVRTLLSYVNGDTLPTEKEDFKELGHGQYGVVYQVNLPDVDLVAAKLLPQSIRNIEHRRDKPRKNDDIEENQEMIAKNQEDQKKKAAEMLIDEIKVMFKAGKHVNIVSLLKVAYPEAKLRFLLRGGIIRDEDSFYLMELCSNGSLESMLKHFLQSSISSNSSEKKLSLYETLSKQTDRGMTIAQALDSCQLTDDDLKLIAYQVANGVDYLNRIQIAHCDIAARNVLVSSRFIMKICDFG
jgi:serine/threonine protein kinase